MEFDTLANEILRNQITEEQIKKGFSFRQKRSMKDIEKYKLKTFKDLGTGVTPGAIRYLSSYLTLILRKKA